jgi:hypothetical protein
MDSIQLRLKPMLHGEGFRARGRTFNRTTKDGLTQVVGLQMGQSDPPGTIHIPGLREDWYGRFWINLGVYIPEVAKANQWKAKDVVREYDCAIRTRVQSPNDGRDGNSWPIIPGDKVVGQVEAAIREIALPFFAGLQTRDQILQRWDGVAENDDFMAVPRIVCAVMLLERGNATAARTLLLVQAQEAKLNHPRHAAYVIELAKRLGVDLCDPSAGSATTSGAL